MKFPNAYSGVKKIFSAEILSVIAVVLLIAASVFGLLTAAAAISVETADAETASSLVLAAGIFAIPTLALGACGTVLAIISFILQLVGVSQAKKDEPIFKTALLFILIGIISTAVSSITGTLMNSVQNLVGNRVLDIFNAFFSCLGKVATILVFYYIITGIISLADQIGNEKIAKQGKTIINCVMIILVLSLIATITVNVFPQNGTNAILVGVLALAALVIEFIAYIIYLVFLGRAKKMLKEATE